MTLIPARLSLAAACAAAMAALAPAFAGEPLDGYELMLVPDRTVLTPANPTATVTVMGGWFGEDAGFGPFGFSGGRFGGNFTSDEPSLDLVGAVSPFINSTNSGTDSTDVLLNNVTWGRSLEYVGQPMPSPYGADEFIPIGTFTFTAAEFGEQRSVMLEAIGGSWPIMEWGTTWDWWVPVTDRDSYDSATASTWLIVVPAPGAAAPLLAAGAFALSRRRRSAL